MRHIVLYTREGCHLCDAAQQELWRFLQLAAPMMKVALEERDVEADPVWEAEFGERIPVVEIDGEHAFDYKFDELRVRKLLGLLRPKDHVPHLIVDARTLREPMSGVGRYTWCMLRALAENERVGRITALVDSRDIWDRFNWPDNVNPEESGADLEDHPKGDWYFHTKLPKRLVQDFGEGFVFWGPAFQVPRGGSFPKLVTIHDLAAFLWRETMPWKFGLYMRKVMEGAVKHADRIVSVSYGTKRDILENLKATPEKIEVIHEASTLGCFEAEFFEPQKSKEAEEIAEAPKIESVLAALPFERFWLHVGALEPRKNIAFLIDVFESLRRKGDARGLVLCGPPGWKNEGIAKALAETRSAEFIHRFDYVNEDELRWLYQRCDALLFPSVYEGFGLPVVEARSCGAKAFVSDRASLPEVAEDPDYILPLKKANWVRRLAPFSPDEQTGEQPSPTPAEPNTEAVAEITPKGWQNAACALVDLCLSLKT